jgi:hypothetical protein
MKYAGVQYHFSLTLLLSEPWEGKLQRAALPDGMPTIRDSVSIASSMVTATERQWHQKDGLQKWINYQRTLYRNEKLPMNCINRLESIFNG